MLKKITVLTYFSLMLAFSLFSAGCATYRDLQPGTIVEVSKQENLSPMVKAEKETGQWRDGRLYFVKQKYVPDTVADTGKTATAIVEQQSITVPPIQELPPSMDYIVGPNDVLFINISGKLELSSVSGATIGGYTAAGATAGMVSRSLLGNRVDGKGNIQLPFVGLVKVGGMTLSEIQGHVRELLAKYIKEPWVIVEIVDYKSHPLYLLGQFRNSGAFYMDRPIDLLQGIALGNGYDSNAYLSGARLIRNKKIVPVDLYDLLTRGDQNQNIWLQPGDTIFIPDNKSQQIFVFGAVKKPGPMPIPPGGLNLAQAIANADIRDIGYDIKYVRIIRSLSPTRGELMVVDYDKILRGEVLPLSLKEGDIIYLPKSNMGNWNDALAEMLPSLQAISAALQPFVNIKYLKQ